MNKKQQFFFGFNLTKINSRKAEHTPIYKLPGVQFIPSHPLEPGCQKAWPV